MSEAYPETTSTSSSPRLSGRAQGILMSAAILSASLGMGGKSEFTGLGHHGHGDKTKRAERKRQRQAKKRNR